MSEWQPIDTAPKDGTVFLAVELDGSWPQPIKWEAYDQEDAEEIGEDGYWAYAENIIAEVAGVSAPTHWMPIPPIPTA